MDVWIAWMKQFQSISGTKEITFQQSHKYQSLGRQDTAAEPIGCLTNTEKHPQNRGENNKHESQVNRGIEKSFFPSTEGSKLQEVA